jgi:fructosamine-3-kinase
LVAALTERGALAGSAHSFVMDAIDAFDRVLPERPRPSLLHGDLWSGNALALVDGTVAVIDPAPSVGDGLADIAMMQIFGGFPATCFRAYAQARGVELAEQRLAAYRLYHMLNHLLIFGSGYLGSVKREASILLGG